MLGMQVKRSLYLSNKKELLKKMRDRLYEEFSYASVLAMDSQSFYYSCDRFENRFQEDELLSKRGFVVKVNQDQNHAEYAFNELGEEQIEEVVQNLHQLMNTETTCLSGKENVTFPIGKEEQQKFCKCTHCIKDPTEVTHQEILQMLADIKEKGLAVDDRILNCEVSFQYQKNSKMFLSLSKELEQHLLLSEGCIVVTVKSGQEVKMSFDCDGKMAGLEVIDWLNDIVENVANRALELLNAKPIIPGEYECICAPKVTGMIAHEALGHGVEMDLFVKDRAMAVHAIGRKVASELVTMHDCADPKICMNSGSYYFDDDGIPTKDNVIIEKGILKQGISDLQTAVCLKKMPTGNGRRESYERKIYSRMSNTYFEPGTDRLEEMIASMSYGFLLEDAESGMEDPKNWGIQMIVNVAREIKDGKLTGNIFSPCVISGSVPDVLQSVTQMSEKIEMSGYGLCGKGYKEYIKVSEGGPYMKCRMHLG